MEKAIKNQSKKNIYILSSMFFQQHLVFRVF